MLKKIVLVPLIYILLNKEIMFKFSDNHNFFIDFISLVSFDFFNFIDFIDFIDFTDFIDFIDFLHLYENKPNC